MNDKELYNEIHNEMFKTGSAHENEWYLINITREDKKAMFEAKLNNKGYIHIRKPFQKAGLIGGVQKYTYRVFRFTGKKELKFSHYEDDVKPRSYVNK